MLPELAVEVVEHDAGFDDAGPVFDIEREDVVQVLGKIDDDAFIDRLAALRSAAAAGGDDPVLVPRDRERPQRLVHGPGNHHAGGQDLVEGGVGRVAAAVEGVEENVAGDLPGEAHGKAAVFSRISRFFGFQRRHCLDPVECPPSLACRGPAWQAEPRFLCIDGLRRAGDKPVK